MCDVTSAAGAWLRGDPAEPRKAEKWIAEHDSRDLPACLGLESGGPGRAQHRLDRRSILRTEGWRAAEAFPRPVALGKPRPLHGRPLMTLTFDGVATVLTCPRAQTGRNRGDGA